MHTGASANNSGADVNRTGSVVALRVWRRDGCCLYSMTQINSVLVSCVIPDKSSVMSRNSCNMVLARVCRLFSHMCALGCVRNFASDVATCGYCIIDDASYLLN